MSATPALFSGLLGGGTNAAPGAAGLITVWANGGALLSPQPVGFDAVVRGTDNRLWAKSYRGGTWAGSFRSW